LASNNNNTSSLQGKRIWLVNDGVKELQELKNYKLDWDWDVAKWED
jgi:hypothetical protein